MDKSSLNKARKLIREKPYLIWHTKDYENLSANSILEAVLNYGDWKDFQRLKDVFGINSLYGLYKNIKNKKRVNLQPLTTNYFDKYFDKYAQTDTN